MLEELFYEQWKKRQKIAGKVGLLTENLQMSPSVEQFCTLMENVQ
jgi:hypothetical protein